MSKQSAKTESKELMEDFQPLRTIYFFENKYHKLIYDDTDPYPVFTHWLYEIPAEDAEKDLKNGYDLWNLGNPPGRLPESCPEYIYKSISPSVPVFEFLQMCFDFHHKQTVLNCTTKN